METTGAELKDWILTIAGNVLIIIFVVRSIGYYAKKEWGEFIVHIIVSVILVMFVYFTDNTIKVLQTIGKLVIG